VTVKTAEGIESSTVSQQVTVFSDEFGRIGLPLIQGQLYLLQIPAIGYNGYIEVPAQASVNLADLAISLKPQFTPYGDPTL
jgi:hypothetical protein